MQEQSHQALLKACLPTLTLAPATRPQELVHELVVLLTKLLRPFSALTYQQQCAACRALTLETTAPRTRMTDEDEHAQLVFRIVLQGSVLVERRFGKTWLHVGFLKTGDTLGLPALLEGSVDFTIMYTSAHVGAQFGVLRRYEFERSLRQAYERQLEADMQLLSRQLRVIVLINPGMSPQQQIEMAMRR